mmetsp:Transcript_26722/g.42334  ORF Transcript_26722/g.42334 Transcript_26722/m.42334 type:complete len:335 (-) Transcript_26722:100-1104(-)|eukprot:CAMPEP_0197054796 /NCGR_PEP_ID=MMETSP1384-20130603/50161_1 /TAXON_ID=29189 /ORGANISM="Ammonia sp." /LENGTH=334 /DNA_ID=CAMNT_0042488109 /DNA_START=25 /DNA_END=1029 /DNA_ORIENTATION=+
MAFSNRVTSLLKVKYPIVCGGMHYVGYAGLAAAVSNAGGLGIITALTQPTPEDLRKEIQKCKALLKRADTPIGVNLTLLPVGKMPDYDAYAQVIIDEKVPVVETAGRNPAKWIKLFKSYGKVIIHKCVAIRHALTAERLGADIISMDGFECGGHPGEEIVGNWVLLPAAAAKLNIPFIASGGCANGQQLAAALALGAEGMNMGTRFMATTEAPIHRKIKQALVDGDERSTTHVMTTLKNTERVYKNKTSDIIQKIEKEKPGDIGAIYQYVRGENYRKSFQETGDTESSVWSCGQSMALINDIPSCEQLIQNIVNEALDVLNKRIPAQLPRRSKL